MLHLIKSSSKIVRLSLILSIAIAAFAVSAYASDNVEVVETIAVDNSDNQSIGHLGDENAKEYMAMTYVDHGGGKVTTTYDVSYTNSLDYAYPYRIEFFILFDQAIDVDSYSVTPLGDTPAFDPVPGPNGGGGIQRIFKSPDGSYSPQIDRNRLDSIPGNTTYTYRVKIDSTETSRATADSGACTRIRNYSTGGRQLTAWIDTPDHFDVNGILDPNDMGMGLDAVISGCADTTNVVPVIETPKEEAPPVTNPPVITEESKDPVYVPSEAEIAAGAQRPAGVGAEGLTATQLQDQNIANNQNNSQNTNTQDLGQSTTAQTTTETQIEKQAVAAQQNQATKVADRVENSTSSEKETRILFNEGMHKNSNFAKTEKVVSPAIAKHAVGSSNSKNHNELVFLMLLGVASSTCFAFGLRKNIKQSKLVVKEVFDRESDFASLEGFAVSSRRVYDTDLRFIDVYGAHEAGKLKARAKAAMPVVAPISKVASKAQSVHPRFDLAMRIWNELMKRTTKQKVKVHN